MRQSETEAVLGHTWWLQYGCIIITHSRVLPQSHSAVTVFIRQPFRNHHIISSLDLTSYQKPVLIQKKLQLLWSSEAEFVYLSGNFLKGSGDSSPDNLIYFINPSQKLSWKMANSALSGPIFKILNRSIGKATNKEPSKQSVKSFSYLVTPVL